MSWFQQHQAQQALNASVDKTLEGHQQALKALEAQVASCHAAAEASEQSYRALQHSVSTFQQSAAAHLKALTDAAEASVQSQGTLQQSVSTFQQSAAAHLKALTDRLAAVAADTTTLTQRLYAAPFTDPPDRFRYTNHDGKRVLGFRSARGQEGDAYLGFEDLFRGSEPFIRARLQSYVPLLSLHDHVVDIGCGRGELLDVLREARIAASGVDTDSAMVRRCRDKGHDVEHTDALSFLQRQDELSLSAVFASQVVEHLSCQDLMAFIQACRAKLRHGGQLIFETVNPHALEAFKTFFTDLTHQRPIFPEVALAWCWLLGFDSAYVFFPNGDDDLERDIKTQGEYAIVATRT